MISTVLLVIKVGVAITIGSLFMSAILSLSGLIANLAIGNVVGEVLSLISVCLPFNALYVFGAIFNAIIGIGGFLVARKVFSLTTSLIDLTK